MIACLVLCCCVSLLTCHENINSVYMHWWQQGILDFRVGPQTGITTVGSSIQLSDAHIFDIGILQQVSSRRFSFFRFHLSCAGLVKAAQRLVSLTSGRQPDDTSERCRDLWKTVSGCFSCNFPVTASWFNVAIGVLITCSMEAWECKQPESGTVNERALSFRAVLKRVEWMMRK